MAYRSSSSVLGFSALILAVFALVLSIGWFRNLGIARTQRLPQFTNFSIALGASYMAVAVIGALGFCVALAESALLAALFTLLAAFATLVVIATGLARIVLHFAWKRTLLNACRTFTPQGQIVYYGFWGPQTHGFINQYETSSWCIDSWTDDCWAITFTFVGFAALMVWFTACAGVQALDRRESSRHFPGPGPSVPSPRTEVFPMQQNQVAAASTSPVPVPPSYTVSEDQGDQAAPPYAKTPPKYEAGY